MMVRRGRNWCCCSICFEFVFHQFVDHLYLQQLILLSALYSLSFLFSSISKKKMLIVEEKEEKEL